MSYSNITLFRNSYFYPNQNYKIDNISEFLNNFLSADKKVFNNQQYWKIKGITTEFKLEINQSEIKNIHEFNYAKVEMINNSEDIEYLEWTLYYFITSFEWISKNTIKLIMRIDTLNTFLDNLQFHPKTFIEREHSDRWNYESYIMDGNNIRLLRNIPEMSEGLEPQKYSYKLSINHLELSKPNDYMYIITTSDQRYRNASWVAQYLGRPSASASEQSILFFTTNDSNVARNFYLMPSLSAQEPKTISESLNLTYENNLKLMLIPYAPDDSLLDISQYTENNPYPCDISTRDFSGWTFTYEGSGGYDIYGIVLNPFAKRVGKQHNWTHISKYFYYKKGNTPTQFDELPINLFTKYFNKNPLVSDIVDNGYFKALGYSNESAMFNSEFLELKFSYCENSYSIHLEDYHYNGSMSLSEMISSDNAFIQINFSFCVEIDSIVFFRFGSGIDKDGGFDVDYKDNLGDLMICPINTQIPLITSAYLDYLRNGYNYDIKIRQVERENRIANVNLKIAQTGATIGLGAMTGGLGGALLGGKAIKSGAGIIGGMVSDYYTTMKEDLEMEKNLAQLKGSKLGVEQINGGIDKAIETNINNKLSCEILAPKKIWWKYLEDYFYYFGNKAQYYGIPTHNNRCLFDYLKCKAEFVNKNSLPTQEALADIIARLNLGVIFVHKFMNKWTFDSDYKENIEVALYNIINPTNKRR